MSIDPRDAVGMALSSLWSHRLRSALTVLGIVIGIAAVVTFVTFGASLRADVVGQINTSTANNIYLLSTPSEEEGFPERPQPVFTERDLSELRSIESLEQVIPQGTIDITSISFSNSTLARQRVTVTTPDAFAGVSFQEGRAFESGTDEVVINDRAVSVFEKNLSVGSEITINRRSNETINATVVGIVNRTSSQLPFQTFTQQARFYLPTEPHYDGVVESPTLGVNQRAYPQVTAVADPSRISGAKEEVQAYLNESDAIKLQPPGYTLSARTGGDIADGLEELINRLTRFVTGLAVISLIVGAIGIANIMLVSVTERTREIGIMKSVGARNRDVLFVFLIEAAVLGAVGSLIALPVGVAGGWVATSYAEIPLTLVPFWFGVAILIGIAVGVLAGIYPAWRAARVDPIEALRRE